MLIAIGVVFGLAVAVSIAAIPKVIYQDHVGLVQANGQLRVEMNSLRQSNEDMAGKLRDVQPKPVPAAYLEPRNSLRRRIVALAAEVKNFVDERNATRPPYGDGKADATGEQKRINEEASRYEIETENGCASRFEDRTRGIIQELKAIGVYLGPGPDSGYFEAMLEQHRSLCENSGYQLAKFKDLAYFVDGRDKLVVF